MQYLNLLGPPAPPPPPSPPSPPSPPPPPSPSPPSSPSISLFPSIPSIASMLPSQYPLPTATATTIVKVEKWAGTLNHTCLPSSAAPDHRCLTPNTTCDLETNTCVCRSKFIPYRGRCLSESKKFIYLLFLSSPLS